MIEVAIEVAVAEEDVGEEEEVEELERSVEGIMGVNWTRRNYVRALRKNNVQNGGYISS